MHRTCIFSTLSELFSFNILPHWFPLKKYIFTPTHNSMICNVIFICAEDIFLNVLSDTLYNSMKNQLNLDPTQQLTKLLFRVLTNLSFVVLWWVCVLKLVYRNSGVLFTYFFSLSFTHSALCIWDYCLMFLFYMEKPGL